LFYLCFVIELNKEQKKLVEKYGVLFKSLGATPAMGKIFGYLIVSEPPYHTFDEIQADLKLSKGAVSNTLKIMETAGMVEYFTIAGDRKRYFKLTLGNWEYIVMKQVEETKRFLAILEESLTLRVTLNDGYEKEIRKFMQVYKRMQDLLINLIKEI